MSVTGGTLDLGGLVNPVGLVSVGGGTISDGTLSSALGFLTTNGVIGASLSGIGSLSQSGAGTTLLSGSNNFTGGAYVSGGTLLSGNANALAGGDVTLSGGVLDLGGLTNAVGNVTNDGGVILHGTLNGTGYTVGSGTVSASLSGGASLVQSGEGTTLLSGSNTFTGGAYVSGGTLLLGNVNALAGGDVTVSGGTLDLGALSNQVALVSLGGGSISDGALKAGSYALTGGAISASLIGSGSLTQSGGGTTVLSGNNAGFSGAVTVASGTLLSGNANSLGGGSVAVNGGTLDLGGFTNVTGALKLGGGTVSDGTLNSASYSLSSGVIGASLVGSGSLIQGGAGTTVLSGDNTGFSGPVAITMGTLSAGASNVGTGAYTIGGSTNLAIFNDTLQGSQLSVGALSVVGNAAILLGSPNSGVASGGALTIGGSNDLLTLSGIWTNGTYTLLSGTSLDLLSSNIAVAVGGGTASLGGTYVGAYRYSFLATNDALDLVVGPAAYNYTWNGGAKGFWNTTTNTWLSNATPPSVAFVDGNNALITNAASLTINVPGNTGISAYGVQVSNLTGTAVIGGGVLAADNMSKTGAGSLTVSSQLRVTNGLTISSSRAVSLLGTNNFLPGGVSVSSASLIVGNNTSLGSGAGAGLLSLSNAYVTYNGAAASSLANAIELAGSDVITNAKAVSLSGNIAGGGTLTKAGAGTLTLTGTNSFTNSSVLAGVLASTGGSSLQGNVGVSNAATLLFGNTNGSPIDFGGSISGKGKLSKTGSDRVSLLGTNSYSGGTLVSGGILLGTSSSFGSGAVTVNSATLSFIDTLSDTFSNKISGTGGLTMSGSGTLDLTGANAYKGGNVVNSNSTLEGVVTSLPGNITDNGTLLFNQTKAGSYAGILSGSGELIKQGGGTLSLTGNNNFSGGVLLTGGALSDTKGSLTGGLTLQGPTQRVTFTDALASALNLASVTLAGNANIVISNPKSQINATGAIDITGNTNVIALTGTYAPGIYKILSGSNVVVGAGSSLSVSDSTLLGTTLLSLGQTNVPYKGKYYSFNTNAAGTYIYLEVATNSSSPQPAALFREVPATRRLAAVLGSPAASLASTNKASTNAVVGKLVSRVLPAVEAAPAEAAATPTVSFATVLAEENTAIGNYVRKLHRETDAFIAKNTAGLYQSMAPVAFNLANAQNSELNQRLWGLRVADGGGFSMNGLPDNTPVIEGQGDGDKGVLDAKKDILRPGEDNRWGMFVDGNGVFAQASPVNTLPGYNSQAGGVTAGLTYKWNENFGSGLYAGYEGSYNRYSGGATLVDNSVRFGAIGTYGQRNAKGEALGFYADALIGGGYNNYNSSSTLGTSTFTSTPGAGELDSMLSGGYDIKKGNWTFGPTASLQYTYFGVGSFSENGSHDLNGNNAGWNSSSMIGSLGAHAAYSWQANQNLLVVPQISLSWQHEFMQNPYDVSSSIGGATFNNWSSAPLRDTLYTGVGVTLEYKKKWNTSFFYNAAAGNKSMESQNIFLSLGLKF